MIALGNTNITKAFLGSTELKNIAIGDELLLSSGPLYDAEVEYVQANGSQRFVMPFRPDNTYQLEGKFGCDEITKRIFILGKNAGGSNYMAINTSGKLERLTSISFVNKTHEMVITPSSTIIDGDTYSVNWSYIFVVDNRYYLTIFSHTQNVSYDGSNIRLYYFRVKINGEIAYDYIPVRSGTTGYLYDRVSKTLLGNAGTGDFILGNDVT